VTGLVFEVSQLCDPALPSRDAIIGGLNISIIPNCQKCQYDFMTLQE